MLHVVAEVVTVACEGLAPELPDPECDAVAHMLSNADTVGDGDKLGLRDALADGVAERDTEMLAVGD